MLTEPQPPAVVRALPRTDRERDDLFALADDIARRVGGPVILEDAHFRVLAYSAYVGAMDRGRVEAILGRRTPDAWLAHLDATGSLTRLRDTDDVVELVDGPWQASRRLLTAVRVGGRLVGVLWVAEADPPLLPDAAALLREAAGDAAFPLLRHVESTEADADRRARHLRALLGGEDPGRAAASELGLTAHDDLVVVALAGESTELLLRHASLCCEAYRWPCASTVLGSTVVLVLPLRSNGMSRPGNGAGAPEGVERLARELVRRPAGGTAAVLAGMSTVGRGLAELPRLRDEAVATLAFAGHGSEDCVRYEHVEADVLVAELVATVPPGRSLRGLDDLQAYDAGCGTDLVTTLRAYLGAGGRVVEAAELLGVHATTLRHRVTRITEVSGLDLNRAEVRVACDVLLRRRATAGDGLSHPDEKGRSA